MPVVDASARWSAPTFPLGMLIDFDEPTTGQRRSNGSTCLPGVNAASWVAAWLDGVGIADIAAILRHEVEHVVKFTADPGLQ